MLAMMRQQSQQATTFWAIALFSGVSKAVSFEQNKAFSVFYCNMVAIVRQFLSQDKGNEAEMLALA
ncbi:hypothetical protein [Acetonema longum]|uniref:hypothetical protein n=1 Tax=Acetonema longum TaxID=2374 RepID=UPI0011124AE2|nr:hypothetical protein [Acetonema longum]